jgi:signal transduction histidine kinase
VTESRKFVHDMKNMLGIIIGYSNLLLDEMPADDPRRSDVDEIRKAGDSALQLLERWDTGTPGGETR